MLKQRLFRRLLLGLATGLALAVAGVSVPVIVGNLTPAYAQVSVEFREAIEPYGVWRRHPRFGEVWVPDNLPPGWRPYTYGRWVYTDDWGWYWVSDDREADWGWVTYHYGRWSHDRQLGWFWVPGNEWGPAWVNWRRGDDFVGWAPAPPDEVVYDYDDDPSFWIFVQPRYLVAPRVLTYVLPPQRTVVIIRETVIVNRTVLIEDRDRRSRIAVNPGIAPGIVAAAARSPVQTFRVQPRVLAGTQGVSGAVQVRPQDLNRGGQRGQRVQPGQRRPAGPSPVQATLQPTRTVVQPVQQVPKAQPLGKDEHGRLGATPPRAAQGAIVAPPPKQAPAPQPQPQLNAPAAPQRQTPTSPPGGASPQTPRTPAPAPSVTPPPPAAQPQSPRPAQPQPQPQVRPPSGVTPPPRQNEPPPQAKPQRPVAPQTPPPAARPAPPQQHAPPPAARPAPPPPPAARPAPPPPPAARPAPPAQKQPARPRKPDEKQPEEKK